MKTQLNTELDLIQHEDIRTLTRAVLDAAPACFWSMPAATTGKYHPTISLGEGGLIRHTRAVVRLTCHLLTARGTDPEEREYSTAVAAAILHDCCKKSDAERYTAFDHPARAAQLIMSTAEQIWPGTADDVPPQGSLLADPAGTISTPHRAALVIAAIVESHMGRWNVNPRTGETLPKPLTPLQRLVHIADYLASRKDITLDNIS